MSPLNEYRAAFFDYLDKAKSSNKPPVTETTLDPGRRWIPHTPPKGKVTKRKGSRIDTIKDPCRPLKHQRLL